MRCGMKSGFWTRTIAATLSGVLGINTLVSSLTAHASGTLQVSLGIPYQGTIDARHNALDGRDRVANSLYLLRNTTVEDLLNTRRSLKILMGGTEHVRRVTRDETLGFAVPGTISDLYLHGSEAPLAPVIRWLNRVEPQYDAELRGRLLTGLMGVSAQLVTYDQQIKFIERDFWEVPEIKNQFEREVFAKTRELLTRMNNVKRVMDIDQAYANAQRAWLKQHKMTDQLSTLAGLREHLLDRYHLLGIEKGGKLLYERIYAVMEKHGFPEAKLVQPPVSRKLPQGTDPIELPTGFEAAIEGSLQNLAADASGELRFMAKIAPEANQAIDEALLESLRANTGRLIELGSEADYSGSRSSPLLALARYEDLWNTTLSKYSYLEGLVDIRGASRR
jgi:hypothetical protein